MKMNKKAYMFTLDLTIAIIILIVGVTILFYHFFASNRTIYFTEQLSEDIIGVLSYTKITDLCVNPGTTVGNGCNCQNYPRLTAIVCTDKILDTDADLLSMMSEIIETGSFPGTDVKDLIREIFVTKNVIDERRFGFAILYWSSLYRHTLELYNTECYPNPCTP